MDSFTRWSEAITLTNITTEAVTQAFLSGWSVLEYLPPLHLTVAANLSLVCCLNSWLSWASTAQTQQFTIPVLMDCVVTGSMEHVTYNI